MALPQDSVNMALFCDFENIALGVRDTKFEKFDIKPVLEKLLLKGSIVVKKAYCDWDRYKTFKGAMHEASFELIEIPHVRQSGKNSADIRLVVDALDLCYTKSHVDTFVIISGDSDFSPLVSKLRENAKRVIGVGVKNSTSDLLVANCDEFIFYDDLARELQRAQAKRESRAGADSGKRAADDKQRKQDGDARKLEAITIAVETFDALASERSDSGKIWASVLKSAIKRRKPGFNETYYGFRAFGNLLDEAQAHGLLEIGRDEKSGTYVSRPAQGAAAEPGFGVEAAKADEALGGGEAPAAVPQQPARHGGGSRHRDQKEHKQQKERRAHQDGGRRQESEAEAEALAQPVQAEAKRESRHDGERRHANKRDEGRHGKGRGSRKPEQMPLIEDAPAHEASAPAEPVVVESTPAMPDEVVPAFADHDDDLPAATQADEAPATAAKSTRAKKTPARARKVAAKKTAAAAVETNAAAETAAPEDLLSGTGEAAADDEAAPAAPAKRARATRSGTTRARRPRGTAGTGNES
ncbi:HTH OST-type domain-containing protein [Burkholderia gladioli]|uniref:NYN domain-containing protein n=1 Tax=Burkholderia gladioli TaxID=28095 RepID=UPI001CB0CEBA|nr:NYN domain-containing protein [Burkholderia gladioli]CAG9198169.1 HTH OST-type domain-containing protein [Burkholderia gladioli]